MSAHMSARTAKAHRMSQHPHKTPGLARRSAHGGWGCQQRAWCTGHSTPSQAVVPVGVARCSLAEGGVPQSMRSAAGTSTAHATSDGACHRCGCSCAIPGASAPAPLPAPLAVPSAATGWWQKGAPRMGDQQHPLAAHSSGSMPEKPVTAAGPSWGSTLMGWLGPRCWRGQRMHAQRRHDDVAIHQQANEARCVGRACACPEHHWRNAHRTPCVAPLTQHWRTGRPRHWAVQPLCRWARPLAMSHVPRQSAPQPAPRRLLEEAFSSLRRYCEAPSCSWCHPRLLQCRLHDRL